MTILEFSKHIRKRYPNLNEKEFEIKFLKELEICINNNINLIVNQQDVINIVKLNYRYNNCIKNKY